MKRIISIMLSVMLMVMLFASCVKQDAQGDVTPTPDSPDASAVITDNGEEEMEITEINMWMMTSNNYDTGSGSVVREVEDSINAITEAEIGVHINFNWVQSSDYATQLNLSIANKETIDLAMYFYSCSLNVLYSGGMASDITDLVDTYAPDLKDTMGSVLDMTRYEGQLYGVAAYRQLNSNGYFMCRSDALETAGVLELAQNMTTWAEFEQVLAAVTEKSGMYGIGGGDSMGLLAVRNLVLGGTSLSDSYFTEALGDTLYLVNCAKDGTVSLAFENPDYIEMCKMIARWHSAGYIWPDTAFNGENKYALVSGGVYCGVIGASEYGIDTQYSDRIGTGSFVRELAPGVVDGSGAKNIGVFVPVAASEPEAAIKLINLFWTNETLMNLIDWGIEGRSYVVNDSGEAAYPEGLDAVSSGYHMNDYMFGNQFLTMPWSGSGSDFRGKALENFLNSRLSAFMGITVDVSSLSGEITAIKAARDEYYTGITSGYYTDKLYQEFMDKLDAAGVDAYLAVFQQTVDEFMA